MMTTMTSTKCEVLYLGITKTYIGLGKHIFER